MNKKSESKPQSSLSTIMSFAGKLFPAAEQVEGTKADKKEEQKQTFNKENLQTQNYNRMQRLMDSEVEQYRRTQQSKRNDAFSKKRSQAYLQDEYYEQYEFELPAIVYKPDIYENEYQIIEPDNEGEPKAKTFPPDAVMQQSMVQQPIEHKYGTYLPEEDSLVEPKKQKKTVEDFIQSEDEMIIFQKILQRREEDEINMQEALNTIDLKFQEQYKLKEDPLKLFIAQTFFEFQPHLIYKQGTYKRSIPSLQGLQANLPILGGFLKQVNLAYFYQQNLIIFWNLISYERQRTIIKIDDISEVILNVSLALENSKFYIIIITVQQILTYLYKPAADGQFTLEKHNKDQAISTDSANIQCCYQSSINGRIFIGGNAGKVSEIQIEDESKRPSFIKSLISGRSKLKKIDKSQSMINKFISSFYENPQERSKVVIDITEHSKSNTLFVAIQNDSNRGLSEIQIICLGPEGKDFQKGFTIIMKDVYKNIEEVTNSIIDPSNIEFIKVTVQQDELMILLNTGTMIFIALKFADLDIEQYIDENQIPISDRSKLKSKQILHEYQVVYVISVPFQNISYRYDSLFSKSQVPDNLSEYYAWKPLQTLPFNLQCQNMLFKPESYHILQFEQVKDHYIFLVEKTQTHEPFDCQYYIYYMTPDYKRGQYYQNTQQLISMTELQGVAHSFSVSETNGRIEVMVLTDQELMVYLLPSNMDIIYSYLSLIHKFEQYQDKQKVIIDDYNMYLKGQDLNETLESLLKIITSSSVKGTVYQTTFAEHYYQNYFRMIFDESKKHEDPSRYRPRDNMIQLVRFVKAYIKEENVAQTLFNSKIQEMAIHQFLEFSSSLNTIEHNSEISKFTAYQQFLSQLKFEPGSTHYLLQEGTQIPEQARLKVIYKIIYSILKPIAKKKLFGLKNGKTLYQEVQPSVINEIIQQLQHLFKFMEENNDKLRFVAIEHEDGLNLKDQFLSAQKLIDKFRNGLNLLSQIYQSSQIQQILTQGLRKEQQKQIVTITLYQYLIDGIENNTVCQLIESYILSLDIKVVEIQQLLGEFRSLVSVFLPKEAISLFLGKRYLQHAYQMITKQLKFDREQFQKFCLLGYNEFMQYPRALNLPCAIEELMKTQQYLHVFMLCLKRIEEIELVEKFITESSTEVNDSNKIKMSEQMIRETIIIITQILEVLVARIKNIEEKTKYEIQKSVYNGVNIFKSQIEKESNIETLQNYKRLWIKYCLKSKSKIFHYDLYEFLLRHNIFTEFMHISTPYTNEFIDIINQQTTLDTNMDLENKSISKSQQITIFKNKFETTFRHLQNLKQMDACFIYIKNQMTNPDNYIDIEERVKWMNIAEGCLLKYKKHKMNLNRDQESATTDQYEEEAEISEEMVKQFHQYNDFFNVVSQIRNKIRESGLKTLVESEKAYYASIDEKISFGIIDVNEAYELAIQQKEWLLFLKLIEINELSSWKPLSNQQITDTQERINYMYREMILRKDYEEYPLLFKDDYKNLQETLLQIFNISKSKANFNVQLFPVPLVLELLEQLSIQCMLKRTDTKFINQNAVLDKEWHPLWHIEFLITHYKQYGDIFRMLSTLKDLRIQEQPMLLGRSRQQRVYEPEELFSVCYMIIRWIEITGYQDIQFKSSKYEMNKAKSLLRQSIQDELIYSKEFVAEVNKLIARVEQAIINN